MSDEIFQEAFYENIVMVMRKFFCLLYMKEKDQNEIRKVSFIIIFRPLLLD